MQSSIEELKEYIYKYEEKLLKLLNVINNASIVSAENLEELRKLDDEIVMIVSNLETRIKQADGSLFELLLERAKIDKYYLKAIERLADEKQKKTSSSKKTQSKKIFNIWDVAATILTNKELFKTFLNYTLIVLGLFMAAFLIFYSIDKDEAKKVLEAYVVKQQTKDINVAKN